MTESALDLIFNIIGTIGVALILIGYTLIQMNKISPKGFLYSFINLVGSTLLFISLLRVWNLPSVIIEICWMLISLYGLFNWLRAKNKKKDS